MKTLLISLSFLIMIMVVAPTIAHPTATAECPKGALCSDKTCCGKDWTCCEIKNCCPNFPASGPNSMKCCTGGTCCSVGTCCGKGCTNTPTDVCCDGEFFCHQGEKCSWSGPFNETHQCCSKAFGCRSPNKINQVDKRRVKQPKS